MGKRIVEVTVTLVIDDEQKDAFALDKVLMDTGVFRINTIDGNLHDIEMIDFDVTDGDDYILTNDDEAKFDQILSALEEEDKKNPA